MKPLSYTKPEVQLSDEDGNAFIILGKVKKAMRQAGATQEELDAFQKEAMSSDYDHLLQTCMDYVEVN